MPKPLPSLAFCIVMDLVGYLSFTIPVFAELADIIWAPVSGLIFYHTFGGWRGSVGGLINFVEELLPGTDFIPSFTAMWLWLYFHPEKKVPPPPQLT